MARVQQRKEACKTEAAVLLLVCTGADLASEELQKTIAIDSAAQEAATGMRAMDAFHDVCRRSSALRARSASCGNTIVTKKLRIREISFR